VAALAPSVERCLSDVREVMPLLAARKCTALLHEVHEANRKLAQRPHDVCGAPCPVAPIASIGFATQLG